MFNSNTLNRFFYLQEVTLAVNVENEEKVLVLVRENTEKKSDKVVAREEKDIQEED